MQMIKRFSDERINTFGIKYKNYEIPCIIIKPKNITKNTKIFFYNGGMGITLNNVKIMDQYVFDEHYLVSFERMEHGSNKSKASMFIKDYVKEMDCVIEYIKKEINLPITLIGESWGGATNFVYYTKHYDKIKNIVSWNIPSVILDPSPKPLKVKIGNYFKVLFTFLTNITTYDKHAEEPVDKITNNPILIRTRVVTDNSTSKNNKSALCAWQTFPKAFKTFKKLSNKAKPMYYIQTGEDYFYKAKKIQRLFSKIKDKKHCIFLPKGYHVLSFDPITGPKLLEIISKV